MEFNVCVEIGESTALMTSDAKTRELDNVGDKLLITSTFEKECMDQMVSEPYGLKQNVSHIFFTIVPKVGKDPNHYILLSSICIKRENIILNVESINCCGMHSITL
jgi:hypothetical protein